MIDAHQKTLEDHVLDKESDFDDKGSYKEDTDVTQARVRVLSKCLLCLMAVDLVSITASLSN